MPHHKKLTKEQIDHDNFVKDTYLLKKFFEFTVVFVRITNNDNGKKSNEITINELLKHIDKSINNITLNNKTS